MRLTRLRLRNFTAFSDLDLEFGGGIEVFVGANGAGKTHLMKVGYAACDVARSGGDFAEKLVRVFLPSGRVLGRLVRRRRGINSAEVAAGNGAQTLRTRFSTRTRKAESARTDGAARWSDRNACAVFIPVQEMLSHSPGFGSLYAAREIHFDETCADILNRASLPFLRGPLDPLRKRLLSRLSKVLAGTVSLRSNGEFHLRNRQGNLEFSLLAEGMRKLGLLWVLIQNGVLQGGSVLFWDAPETSLNPSLFGEVIEVLLELQRIGVQVFLATHDYVILKELDLRAKSGDKVCFHSLYSSEETGETRTNTVHDYREIHPNAIADTFSDLYDRTIDRSLRETSD